MYPAYYPDWILDEIPDTDYPDRRGDRIASSAGAFYDNAVKLLGYGSYSQSVGNKLYTDVKLKQDLDFITKGLSLSASFSLSTYYSRISQSANHENPVYYIDWDLYDAGVGNPWVNNKSTGGGLRAARVRRDQGWCREQLLCHILLGRRVELRQDIRRPFRVRPGSVQPKGEHPHDGL